MNFPQQTPQPYADPLEQRDSWRALWLFLTSDGVLAVLCALVGLMALVALILPQTPLNGTADPYAYSLWQTQAQAQTGSLYEILQGIGLFNVFQQTWVRLLMALLAAVSFLRLFDAAARLRLANLPAHVLRDELRVRVTDSAPTIAALQTALQHKRYRVVATAEELHANRTPSAEGISIALHTGLLVLLLGALLNGLLGWRIANRALISNTPTLLAGSTQVSLMESQDETDVRVALDPGSVQASLLPNQPATLSGIAFDLKQVTTGYRISATRAGQPLSLTLSNFSPPATDVQLTFLPDERERFLAVPQAGLVLQVSLPISAAPQLQAFAVPAGNVMTQTAIAPSVVISNVTMAFKPSNGAIVDASYQPGNPLLWIGLALAVLGGLGSLLYPVQRIVVRHHGHWTEFYASGRGVRKVIARLLLP
jgi:ResB-like family